MAYTRCPEAVEEGPRAGESRHRTGDQLPPDPRLPDLAPAVDDLFRQLSAG